MLPEVRASYQDPHVRFGADEDATALLAGEQTLSFQHCKSTSDRSAQVGGDFPVLRLIVAFHGCYLAPPIQGSSLERFTLPRELAAHRGQSTESAGDGRPREPPPA